MRLGGQDILADRVEDRWLVASPELATLAPGRISF